MNDINEFNLKGWENFFAEERPRQAQADALDFVARNWDNCDNFILNCPTGIGKSAIGLTLARTLASQVEHMYDEKDTQYGYSYLTTTSIELQNQYQKSYEKLGLRKIYSASNFRCTQTYPMNCKEGKNICKNLKKKCPKDCPYDVEKSAFMVNPFGIMNLAYYLYETHFAKKLMKRGLMIFDEAHNIGDYVKTFVTIEITDFHLNRHRIKAPRPDVSNIYKIEELKKWLNSEYMAQIKKEIDVLNDKIDNWSGSKENREYLKLCDEESDLSGIAQKINHLSKELNSVDWVAERLDDRISITPISPKKYMKEYLIGRNFKNVFMSATLFDKKFTMSEYDLDPTKTCYFTTPSPFPIKNRPIYILPAGKLEYNNLAKSMKPFSDIMGDILDGHKNERGIVFVSSYFQANELIKQVKNPRLITHVNAKDKIDMMEIHKASKDTVIVSPSMHEGVDLKDDLSRFQVVLKMPFMSLGSYSVKRRAELYPEWYAYKTVLMLIQSTGRSIRSDTDTATTYILDQNFVWFFEKWKHFFPTYWTKSIIK